MFTVQQIVPDQTDSLVVLQGHLAGTASVSRDSYAEAVKNGGIFGVADGDQVVGAYAAKDALMTVPGGAAVRAELLSDVVVLPTHRRRGIMRSMMQHYVQDAMGKGVLLSFLRPSEADIYGRFEYGLGCMRLMLRIESRRVHILPPAEESHPVELSIMGSDRAIPLCEDIRQRLMSSRPGWTQMEPANPDRQAGMDTLRCLMARRDGEYTGYVRYSVRPDAESSKGTVTVWETEARDAGTRIALWRFLLSIDLVDTVIVNSLPTDDPILSLASDIRRCHATLRDDIHVRLVDIPAALTARQYASPLDVVLEISDELVPDNTGRWHLTSDGATSECSRTSRPADVVVASRDLARTYLGGSTLEGLARAGRVVERRRGSLLHASCGFAVSESPWIPPYF